MSPHRRRGGGLFPGVILIAVGTIFLLQRFDLLPVGAVGQLWPLFVIWMGLFQLIKPKGGRRSIFLLLIGIWLQISTLELFGLDFSRSWPLLIIAVGASFVFDSITRGSSPRGVAKVVIEVQSTEEATDEQ